MKKLFLALALVIWACDPVPVPSNVASATSSASATASVEPSGEPSLSAEPSVSTEPSVEPTEPPTPEPSLPDEPLAEVFQGEGTATTEQFPVPAGNYLVDWRVESGPCTVDFTLLLPDYGDEYPIGHAATNDVAHGQYRVTLPEGFYQLEVNDPGCDWTVYLTQQ